MADDKFKAGLDDQDEMGQFPSAANPLTAMGLDPDEVRANPDMLKSGSSDVFSRSYDPLADIPKDPPKQPAAPSAVAAGKTGGAGATVSTSTGAPQTDEDYEKAGLEALYQNSQKANKAVDDIQTAPPADVTRLQAQREKLATPAQRFDPTTGKQLTSTPVYNPQTGQMETIDPKASTGEKIWRGVRGGLLGLATGGIQGAIVGGVAPQDIRGGQAYNAPSRQYNEAEARRKQSLQTTEQSLQQARDNWKAAVDAAKTKAAQFKDNAVIGNDLASRATTAKDTDTKAAINQFKAEATADNYKTKADEAGQKLQEQMQRDLQTAQNNEQRIQILQNNAALADQLHRAQLDFAKQKLSTTQDAKTIDQWQKEQIDSVNKDYNGILSSAWNRITAGSKQDRIAEINKTADSRRAALGLGTGVTTPKAATPTASTPPAKGYTRVKASDGSLHDIPNDKLSAARQRDPKLSVMGAGQ